MLKREGGVVKTYYECHACPGANEQAGWAAEAAPPGEQEPMYRDQPLTVLVGRITEVGTESHYRRWLPARTGGTRNRNVNLTSGTRVMVRGRRIRGEYIAEMVITEKETAFVTEKETA